MVNKYKEFEGYFGDYSQYADALGFIDENDRVSKKERKLAASIFNDEDTQNYFLNVARDPNEFKLIFNGKLALTEQKIDGLTRNLESLLNDAPEEDVEIGIQMVEPKEDYSGNRAGLYKGIAGLHKGIKSMAEVAQSGNYGQMKTDVGEYFSTIYDNNNEKDRESLTILNLLLSGGTEFGQYMYGVLANKKQEQFATKLKGNEPGYLAANLEGVGFIPFYDGLLQMKEEMARQNQREAQEQGPRRRRPVQRQSPRTQYRDAA